MSSAREPRALPRHAATGVSDACVLATPPRRLGGTVASASSSGDGVQKPVSPSSSAQNHGRRAPAASKRCGRAGGRRLTAPPRMSFSGLRSAASDSKYCARRSRRGRWHEAAFKRQVPPACSPADAASARERHRHAVSSAMSSRCRRDRAAPAPSLRPRIVGDEARTAEWATKDAKRRPGGGVRVRRLRRARRRGGPLPSRGAKHASGACLAKLRRRRARRARPERRRRRRGGRALEDARRRARAEAERRGGDPRSMPATAALGLRGGRARGLRGGSIASSLRPPR